MIEHSFLPDMCDVSGLPPPPPKKMQFKNRWSPQINKHPRLKTTSAEIHFLSNNFYFQFYLFPIIFYIFFIIIVILKV